MTAEIEEPLLTRIEVIESGENGGRVYMNLGGQYTFYVQDDQRTLKIFVKPNEKKAKKVQGEMIKNLRNDLKKIEKNLIKVSKVMKNG